MSKTQKNTIQKNKKSILLSQQVIICAELIKEAIKENKPPTIFIKKMIIILRKLDYNSENSLTVIDKILFSESFR